MVLFGLNFTVGSLIAGTTAISAIAVPKF